MTIRNSNNEATAYWFELRTDRKDNILEVVDQGGIDAEDLGSEGGTHTYKPSLAVNTNRVSVFGFFASSPNLFFRRICGCSG